MDDVVIDCPWEIDEDMMASLNIEVVVHGTTHDSSTVSWRVSLGRGRGQEGGTILIFFFFSFF